MKYHNKKVKTKDGVFDSMFEYEEWVSLKDQEKRGEIFGLQRQVRIELLPHFKTSQGMIRAITYTADFVFYDGGIKCIMDTKGYPTKDYLIKKKMLLSRLKDNECFIERKKGENIIYTRS